MAQEAPGNSGTTLVVLSENKIAEIMERAKPLMEIAQRHELDLIKAGGDRVAKADNSCCNCVLC